MLPIVFQESPEIQCRTGLLSWFCTTTFMTGSLLNNRLAYNDVQKNCFFEGHGVLPMLSNSPVFVL